MYVMVKNGFQVGSFAGFGGWSMYFCTYLYVDRRTTNTQTAKQAELAQSVERTTLNRVVVGSIPTFGGFQFLGRRYTRLGHWYTR